MSTNAFDLYNDLWATSKPGFEVRIGQSLNPRGPKSLEERFAQFSITADDVVLDAGCRDADYAVDFAKQFGCRVIALDPMPHHMELAAKKIAEAGVADQVTAVQGWIEEMPLDDRSIDYLWCRDTMNLVEFRRGVPECFRVLRPGGRMLVYQNFATELMEPNEARRLYEPMAIRPENMQREYFEQEVTAAGFRTLEVDVIGTEWRERGMEEGWQSMDPLLLRMARIRRLEAELVAEYGRAYVEAEYAAEQWLVYQALGKLCPVIHVLQRP